MPLSRLTSPPFVRTSGNLSLFDLCLRVCLRLVTRVELFNLLKKPLHTLGMFFLLTSYHYHLALPLKYDTTRPSCK